MGQNKVACTFIGGGVLACCLIDGLLDSANARDLIIRVTARRPEHAQSLRQRYPSLLVSHGNRAASLWDRPWPDADPPAAHIVLICTQPRFTAQVCEDLRAVSEMWPMHPRPVFVTMCPGVTVAQLERWLPAAPPIVRTMPNTPAAVREGATALFANDAVSRAEVAVVTDVFRTVSPAVCELEDESGIDVAAAISGCVQS